MGVSPQERPLGLIATLALPMHFFWLFLVWMVYSILAIGVLEAHSERNADAVRGAGTAMILGGVLAVLHSLVIFWFGPVGPW